MARYETSISTPSQGTSIGRRAYNILTYGLVTLSFLILWGTYLFASSGGLNALAGGGIVVMIVSLVASIGGIILMSIGKSKQSVGLSIAGYALFSLTFGFTTSLILTHYDIGTITYAFGITACVSGIFLVAGLVFPDVFLSIGRVLGLGIFALIAVEIVATFFFHADQTIFDYLFILLFCGFLGYDSVYMASDDPTVPNAIYHASNIYLDIINILIRVLDLLDNK